MEEARKLRSEFLQVLRSRRSGEVPMLVEPAKPVANPLFQEANPPSFSELQFSQFTEKQLHLPNSAAIN
ncbi:hypothetical protein TB2_016569 [Malus domestica]